MTYQYSLGPDEFDGYIGEIHFKWPPSAQEKLIVGVDTGMRLLAKAMTEHFLYVLSARLGQRNVKVMYG